MSKIKDILIDIETYLSQGYVAEEIARILDIPLVWVTEYEMDAEYTQYPNYNGESL